MFHTNLVAVPLESMNIRENLIRGLDESRRNYTVMAFRQFGSDPRIGRIRVTIHSLGNPEDRYAESLIERRSDKNCVLRLKEGIRFTTIDDNNRHYGIL